MATVKDPICGKDVDTLRARAVGIFGGQTCYFCSQECKAKYVDPRKAPRPASSTAPARPSKPEPIKASKPEPPAQEPTPAPRKDPSLEELPPMEAALPDLTPARPRPGSSPSVRVEIGEVKKESRRWAVIIVILAALVVAAVVLSLRN